MLAGTPIGARRRALIGAASCILATASACGTNTDSGLAAPTTAPATTFTSTATSTSTATVMPTTTLTAATTVPAILPTPPTTAAPSRLDALAISVRDGQIVEFDVSDGAVGRQLFAWDSVGGVAASVRRVDGRPEIYLSVPGPSMCSQPIMRINDSGVTELGLAGTGPRFSRDGRHLAYMAGRARVDAPDRCEFTLAVRTVATGAERRWPLGEVQGFFAPLWAADDRHLYVAHGGEYPYGEPVVLDTIGAPDGLLWDVAVPIAVPLGDGEYVSIQHASTVDEGVFVQVLCCKDATGYRSRTIVAHGVLGTTALRRIELTQTILAVDPTVSVMVFEERGSGFAARIDGTERRRIPTSVGWVIFY
jgi:hypothetical protein